jgi:hypothetical protein
MSCPNCHGSKCFPPEGVEIDGTTPADSVLPALVNLLALAGCVGGWRWLVRQKEQAAHRLALMALRRPALLGLALIVLSWSSSESLFWLMSWRLGFTRFGPVVFSNLAQADALASSVLWPLQTLLLVVLVAALKPNALAQRGFGLYEPFRAQSPKVSRGGVQKANWILVASRNWPRKCGKMLA